ncbi:hypothetical protein FNH09_08425 [Streptomyces adustus]|uniref:Uncharacterized protein n=1 Tax=Streptomyces adustus TaxID=1609272 RepID=A0A5N8V7Y5_9ACTN|nr:hypothetical protein [Streptomyces adustus]MPY31323.1 hypothetical protein [Streptomyces adustus]
MDFGRLFGRLSLVFVAAALASSPSVVAQASAAPDSTSLGIAPNLRQDDAADYAQGYKDGYALGRRHGYLAACAGQHFQGRDPKNPTNPAYMAGYDKGYDAGFLQGQAACVEWKHIGDQEKSPYLLRCPPQCDLQLRPWVLPNLRGIFQSISGGMDG